jgi:putative transposase
MKAITDTLEVARSHQYEKTKARTYATRPDDEKYLTMIQGITNNRPSYGYRRTTALVNRALEEEGKPRINHKRIYRLMKLNHLLLERHTGHPLRVHNGTIITLASNMRWCSDGFEIPCDNGAKVRVIFALDCADREVLSYLATTGGITGEMVRDLMALAVENRFGPLPSVPHVIEWLSDNGPAYAAHETRAFARLIGLEPCTTPYYSPESNGMAGKPSSKPLNETMCRSMIARHLIRYWRNYRNRSMTTTSIILTRDSRCGPRGSTEGC